MEYIIRTTALLILSEIYLQCDHSFKVSSLDCAKICTNTDKTDIQKAIKYLSEKRYIEPDGGIHIILSCNITSSGIDWVEDSQNN